LIEIEQSIIGSVLLRENRYLELADMLTVDDFTSTQGKESWLAISNMYGTQPVTLASVYPHVTDNSWIVDSTNKAAPNVKQAGAYLAEGAKKIRIRDKLLSIATDIDSTKSSSNHHLEEVMRVYQEEIGWESAPCDIASVVDRFAVKQKQYKDEGFGLSTGFECFTRDYITYRPGHLWCVGAWTSTGKTTYMISALKRIVLSRRVVVFSTEMVEEQNVAKILGATTGYNPNVILSGNLLDNHAIHVDEHVDVLRKADLHIYDKIRTTAGIATQCRKLNMKKQLDVVFVDFIQNLDTDKGKKYDTMSNAAVVLQNLAHELRCTIVCLSQIPNSAGKIDSGILEFKGAGEIAAAADVGVLMKRATDDNKVILFDVRKNRHGACKKYLFRFNDSWTDLIEEGEARE
jgi:replicative DNA helicase